MLVRTLASAAQKFGLPIKLLLIGMRSTAERNRLIDELDPGERAILSPKTLYFRLLSFQGFTLRPICMCQILKGKMV